MLLMPTLKSPTNDFPLALVCPGCGTPLEAVAGCACPTRLRLESYNGLPRTLFGQKYWGECSEEKMHALLALGTGVHWKDALKQVAGDEPVYRHLTAAVGADFIYCMPWDEIETALDIGAGMGFLTIPMAGLAQRVVAVEAVPERAQFIARRALQDGLDNVFPIIASGTALPFEPESFDLITLNGVFEYIGLWGQGDPQALQQSFLERAFQLLRPGGYLYIGIEQRFALGSWLGARDHSGLRFTSLMPRFLADLCCKLRSVPFYGSAHAIRGYRTYTHSPRAYEQMVRKAGFETVEVHGVFDGYNRQIGTYPLKDYEACRAMRHIVNPAGSRLGLLRGKLRDLRPLHALLEDEVLVLARKQRSTRRIAWSFLDAPGPVTQFNTSDKAFALCFTEGKPTSVYKTTKIAKYQGRTEHEFSFLLKAEDRLGSEAEALSVRWSKPVGKIAANGRTHYQYEFAPGPLLAHLLLPARFRRERFREVLAKLGHGYVELCGKMSARMLAPERSAARERAELSAALEQSGVEDHGFRQHLHAACNRLRQRAWQPGVVHGDLSLSNAVLLADGGIVLVDWENASETGLIALDLMRLLYDTWVDSRILRAKAREAVMADARMTIGQVLRRVAVTKEDFADIEVLFIAHHSRFVLARHGEVETILRAHRERAFSLTGERS